MSIWTHVAGIFRVDNVILAITRPEFQAQEQELSIKKLTEIITKGLPEGSEGPLKYFIDVPRLEYEHADLRWANIILTGDLRDFGEGHSLDDIGRLRAWIHEKADALIPANFMLRQAVVTIMDETKDVIETMTWTGYNLTDPLTTKWRSSISDDWTG